MARLWPTPPEAGSGPVLLHAVAGFVDAGSAGEVAVDHLLEIGEVTRLVTFDADQLIDLSRIPI